MTERNQSVLPSLLKAALVVAVVLLVLGMLVTSAVWYWWSRHGDQVTKSAVSSQQEGMEAGKHMDQQGCLDESFARLERDPGFESNVKIRLFLTGCLQNAKSSPDFCEGVPQIDQFMESVKWRIQVCEKRKQFDPNDCQTLFAIVQARCTVPSKDKQ